MLQVVSDTGDHYFYQASGPRCRLNQACLVIACFCRCCRCPRLGRAALSCLFTALLLSRFPSPTLLVSILLHPQIRAVDAVCSALWALCRHWGQPEATIIGAVHQGE